MPETTRGDIVDLSGDAPPTQFNVATLPPASAAAINLCDSDDGHGLPPTGRKRRRPDRGAKESYGRRGELLQSMAGEGKSDPNECAVMVTSSIIDVDQSGSSYSAAEYEVLEIFPDADFQHVTGLLAKFDGNIAVVVAHMAESAYPKSKALTATLTPSGSALLRMERATQWKFDYSSTESFKPSVQYIKEATEQLLREFPFLSKFGSQRILAKFKHHFAVSYDKIMSAIKGSTHRDDETLADAQYRRVLFAFNGHPLDKEQVDSMEKLATHTTLKSPRKKIHYSVVTENVLQEEISFVHKKRDDWLLMARGITDRRTNKEVAILEHNAVDCSCCFDDVAIQDMVACRDEGHLFCVDCLKAFVENQVYGSGNLGIDRETKQPALELKCFHSDGCSSGFSRHALDKALPIKTLQKYDEIQFQVSLEAAGITDMCSCPKCGFQAALPPTQKVFQCPVVDCRFDSCRDCGEAAHIPLRCDEVEKEVETKGRLSVEEAISETKIRKCPNCAKAFIKSDGCNKIRCGCGVFVCYICRLAIKNYAHFCQMPHCDHASCNKCPLWTKAEEDDSRAMREAGLAAAAKMEEKLQAVAMSLKKPPNEFKIDVESILKQPS